MVLKYGVRVGDWPVSIAGLLHGVVFLSFAATAVLVGLNQRWPVLRILGTAAAAVVPYATIPVERWLSRRGALRGVWRSEEPAVASGGRAHGGAGGIAGGSGRGSAAVSSRGSLGDAPAVDSALRWVLARPRTLAALLVATVAAITAVLLVIGPPGGRG